jgi:hypothetical protein
MPRTRTRTNKPRGKIDYTISNLDEVFSDSDSDSDSEASDWKTEAPLAIHHPFRMLICAASNRGKSNAILDWILHSILDHHSESPFIDSYEEYCICSKLWQSQKNFRKVKELFDNLEIENIMTDSIEELPDLDEMDSSRKLIFIDDFNAANEKKAINKINNYMMNGRHKNMSLIVAAQDPLRLPKPWRINISHIMLQPLSEKRQNNEIMKAFQFPCEDEVVKKWIDILIQNRRHKYSFLFFSLNQEFPDPWNARLNFDKPLC